MGGIRKLKRRSRSTQYAAEPLRQKYPFPLRKMSEVVLDFAGPLLNTIDDDDELFEEVICFAAFCWNTSFLPENEQKQMVQSLIDDIAKSDILQRLRFEDDIRMLLERKKAFFADDRRIVVNYEVIEEEDRQRLLVMSTLAKDRPDETQRVANKSQNQ